MKINFNYKKQEINYISGDIFKGKNYRCRYIRFKSLYNNPAHGCENVHLYNYEPKRKVRASSMILHGLGSRNIKFLLWLGPHLASVGVNTSILILPGNYTRVEEGSVSGKSYLYPDLEKIYQFWEHAVVDVRSSIDLLKQLGLWMDNNLLTGYCLGGMIASIVAAVEDINHTIFMTAGAHIPSIMYESPAVAFIPKLIKSGYETSYGLHDKEYLYQVYKEDLPKLKDMTLDEFLDSDEIHPLLKVDPASYTHFLNKDKLTFIDAYFDRTLPKISREIFYQAVKGAKRRVLPITHVSWLPFSYLLAKYMLHKVNIKDRQSEKQLLEPEDYDNPLDK